MPIYQQSLLNFPSKRRLSSAEEKQNQTLFLQYIVLKMCFFSISLTRNHKMEIIKIISSMHRLTFLNRCSFLFFSSPTSIVCVNVANFLETFHVHTRNVYEKALRMKCWYVHSREIRIFSFLTHIRRSIDSGDNVERKKKFLFHGEKN